MFLNPLTLPYPIPLFNTPSLFLILLEKNHLLPYVLFFTTLSFQTGLPYPSLFCNSLISSAIFEWHSIQKGALIRQQSSDEKHTDHHPPIDRDKAQGTSSINNQSIFFLIRINVLSHQIRGASSGCTCTNIQYMSI